MATFSIAVSDQTDGVTTLKLSFGDPAQNTQIVCDAVAAIRALNLAGGKGCKLNGPASLPVALAIGHAIYHVFGWVACFDPKLSGYVVAVSHDPAVQVGALIS